MGFAPANPAQDQMAQQPTLDMDLAPGQSPRTTRVLLPLALPGAYDYLVPDDLDLRPGDFVRVPLGPREVTGVVWDPLPDTAEAKPIDPARLKAVVSRFDAPPMPDMLRQFVDWVAAYTLSAPGAVLRLAMRVPQALEPSPRVTGYRMSGHKPARMTPKRERVLEMLHDTGPELARPAREIADMAGVGTGVVKGLVDAGALEAVDMPGEAPFPEPLAAPAGSAAGASRLNDTQAQAAADLAQRIGQGFSATLLDGVTGAGKTEVYFEAIAEALRQGRQVLVLLPEIALTPQLLKRFETRFGAAPAPWHSDLGQKERRRIWRGVAEGRARVVVGARSALFLPFTELGLIIVDEEHEAAFKQEEGVIYNARDMAVARASLGGFPVVLASATPSLETVVNVQRGRYQRLVLPERHGAARLPDVEAIDLRADAPERGRWLSHRLVMAIGDTLAAGNQAMLFLNRRGYAPLTLCRTCGHRFECPNCDAWLVEHRFRKELQCHHCGTRAPTPHACPECGTENSLAACGPGVERIAEEAAERFPEARLAVLSSDLLHGPAATQEAMAQITRQEVDLVIGTQVVAKGHNFPNLTLVGVVDSDLGLTGGDLRAAERTYQLLHQVAGRAGRGEKPGRVLLQTYMPHHKVMQALIAGDRDRFLEQEADERHAAGMPPFGRLVSVILSGPEQGQVMDVARELVRAAPQAEGVRVLGPAPAPIALLRGRHRMRFLLKTVRDFPVQKYVRAWLGAVKVPNAVRLAVDVDPQSFL
ncbi:primosomal protein N' [Pyruvatibacter mobilis]|uniref:primosomal protein N' n=1 Tax=Pyruvatibacter mobilis TaxID=1712261 RepID=UPI003D143387